MDAAKVPTRTPRPTCQAPRERKWTRECLIVHFMISRINCGTVAKIEANGMEVNERRSPKYTEMKTGARWTWR